jgi:hypothetical protein
MPHLQGLAAAVQGPAGGWRNGDECSPNMSDATELEDPDFRVQAAWLAQVSGTADGRLAEQVPKQGAGKTTQSTGQEANLVPPRLGRRSSLIKMVSVGSIVTVLLAAVIAIASLFESWRQPADGDATGLASSEPLASAPPAVQNELGTPKLFVESFLGIRGEPAPLGLALRGRANDAVVIIRGLLPGMELSAGSAVAGDTWRLSANDLTYAWIAPPPDFVGSADLIAELHLPNAQIVDRQTIHVEWAQRAGGSGREHEHEPIAPRQENEMMPPIAPPDVQHPTGRDVITAAPPTSAAIPQGQLPSEEKKSARAREKNNLRRSVSEGDRHAPFGTPRIDDSTHAVKGFWDWSR